jgi:hypothetical protein
LMSAAKLPLTSKLKCTSGAFCIFGCQEAAAAGYGDHAVNLGFGAQPCLVAAHPVKIDAVRAMRHTSRALSSTHTALPATSDTPCGQGAPLRLLVQPSLVRSRRGWVWYSAAMPQLPPHP